MPWSEAIYLKAHFGGFELRAGNERAAGRLMAHVVEYLDREHWDHHHWISTGKAAEFVFVVRNGSAGAEPSDTYLRIQIDREADCGVLTWCAMASSDRKGGVNDAVWLSDNPSPMDADPGIAADEHCGYLHDRASAIPLKQIRAAVEEYCCLRPGDRPGCVRWVQGHLDGQRTDRPPRPKPEPDEFGDAPW